MTYSKQPSNQPTYYPIPQSVDFGTIAIGDTSQVQKVEIEYRLPPTDSVGGTISTQGAVSSESFQIDDMGTDADDFITLSVDGISFFNNISVASFPATAPPNVITIFIKVAPSGVLNKFGDYTVFLRAAQVPRFALPIHFRITGGQYIVAADVRQKLGPLGKQRTTISTLQDTFADGTFPLWTNDTARWTQDRTSTRTATTTSTGIDTLSHITVFSDFGDYNISAIATLQSSGDAGLVFGYVSATNYFRALISSRTGNAEIDQVTATGTTVLSQVSIGTVNGTRYTIRLEKHPTTADFYVNENFVLRASGITPSGSPGLVLTSSGGNLSTVDFNEFHNTQDVFVFQDSDINQYIQEAQGYMERRTQKIWLPQIATELYDYNEQDVKRMPFILNRSFNTLPNFDPRPGLQAGGINDHSLFLKLRPVLNVIAVEEDINNDGGVPTWQLKMQGRDGDYVVYPDLGKIVFVDNLPRNGHQNIKVIYTIGTASVPFEVRQYVAVYAALSILSTIGGSQDGVSAQVDKLERLLQKLEEFIPQKTLQYVVGSGKPVR